MSRLFRYLDLIGLIVHLAEWCHGRLKLLQVLTKGLSKVGIYLYLLLPCALVLLPGRLSLYDLLDSGQHILIYLVLPLIVLTGGRACYDNADAGRWGDLWRSLLLAVNGGIAAYIFVWLADEAVSDILGMSSFVDDDFEPVIICMAAVIQFPLNLIYLRRRRSVEAQRNLTAYYAAHLVPLFWAFTIWSLLQEHYKTEVISLLFIHFWLLGSLLYQNHLLRKKQEEPPKPLTWRWELGIGVCLLLIAGGLYGNHKWKLRRYDIHAAVLADDIARVESILAHHPQLANAPRVSDAAMPLHLAGNVEMVELLISQGAATDTRTMAGDTPLHMALRDDDVKRVELLLSHTDHPIFVNPKTGLTPLHEAQSDEALALLATHAAYQVSPSMLASLTLPQSVKDQILAERRRQQEQVLRQISAK